MEKFNLDEDIRVFCVTAASFPDGIMEAHEKLRTTASLSPKRKFFGISRPENGAIVYKAAAEELETGEGKKLGFETFVIRKGQYISLLVKDFWKDELSIKHAFERLTSDPDIDPEGYCVEWYLNDNDVRCMIRLEDSKVCE